MPLATLDVTKVAYAAFLGYYPKVAAYDMLSAEIQAEMLEDTAMVLADPTLSARAVHQARVEARRAAGWQYGVQYDPVKKTDPYIVDYDALPAAERLRYKILVATAVEAAAVV